MRATIWFGFTTFGFIVLGFIFLTSCGNKGSGDNSAPPPSISSSSIFSAFDNAISGGNNIAFFTAT
ncbi:MAG: hypothetical protein LBP89_05790 [Helicobacteraceae bacterium]|nr:hypothetical protein [Helicobacteraceae bacterium]